MRGLPPRGITTRCPGAAYPAALLLLLVASHPTEAWGRQASAPTSHPWADSLDAEDAGSGTAPAARLEFDLRREASVLGLVAGFHTASELVPEPIRFVPATGFDPLEIDWSVDRNVLGTSEASAGPASDHARDAAVLLPMVLSAFTAGSWRTLAASGGVYAEALLITRTVTHLGKVAFGRPRPGTYGPQPVSEAGLRYAPSASAFHSMPSGHASAAWTGAAMAFTSHLLLRPRASGAERFGLGFVAGALAGATSALRVEAGAHFPSDVIAGAGVGIASGILVPLAHRGELPLPRREAWLQTIAGVALGTVTGVVLGSD